MANEVKLTFAGDATQLERTFGQVGDSAKKMGDKVGDAGAGFDRAREGFDQAEQRAMGFRDTITGVQDSVKGFSSILKGDFSGDALLAAGAGIGDLASGFANFLVPSLKKAVVWLGNTRVGMIATTVAQRALNLAMSLNPIGIVIIALTALVAAFVILWNKSEAFRNFWKGAWDEIKTAASNVVDWFAGLPEKIGGFFSSIGDKIAAPFRTAFNFVADAWNNTVGKLRWTVPRWVPFIGGNSVGAPQLPHFHAGIDRVPGTPGSEMLAVLQAGERVVPASRNTGGGTTVVFQVNGSRYAKALMEDVARGLREVGGLKVVVR